MARIEGNDTRVSTPKVETKPQTNPETNPQSLSTVTNNSFTGRDSKLGELSTRESQMRTRITGETTSKPPTPPPPPDLATQATVTINGSQVIIDAGAGDDAVGITQDPTTGDVIVNVNGAERAFSGADRDNLVIRAGDGNDTITVGKGVTVDLRLEGEAGDDHINVDSSVTSQQTIEAGAGNDVVYAGGGRDYINGSTGEDRLFGRGGDDVIYGGDDDDSIYGGSGNDYLDAGRGNDRLYGFSGSDVLSGGIGDDTVNGGSGDDVLYSGQGTDNLIGSTGNNSIYAQTGIDTIQESDAANNVNNVVVNVELVGNPGGLSVKVEGSAEFIERVEADLETLRSSPTGRAMLEAFDQSYIETRSSLSEVPLIGGLFNDGTTVTIRETDGGNTAQKLESGRSDSQINYNTQRISLGGGGWTDRPPIVGFYHEMAHSYDGVYDTFAPGQYFGTDTTNQGVNNLERVAVGLPIDHDNDPSTPEIQDPNHPTNLTENTLRDEMKLPLRPRY